MQKTQMFINNFGKIFEQWVVGNNYRNSICFSFFYLQNIKEFNFANLRIYNAFGYPLFKNQYFISFRCLIKSFSNKHILLTLRAWL